MSYIYQRDLASILRKAGQKVVVLDGWKNRGRPSYTGGLDPEGVLCHHTGSSTSSKSYAEWMAYTGRSDLPAPLCHLALGQDGTWYVSAAGRANHAGVARATGPMPSGDGNELYIGIEAMNAGAGYWPEAQYSAYVRGVAAICDAKRWPASHVRGHKESSVTGKVDPGGIDMDKFRSDVAKAMKASQGPPLRLKQLTRIAERQKGRAYTKGGKQQVRRWVSALRAAGYDLSGWDQQTAIYGPRIRKATRRFQQSQGWSGDDADGLPGPTTARLLGLIVE